MFICPSFLKPLDAETCRPEGTPQIKCYEVSRKVQASGRVEGLWFVIMNMQHCEVDVGIWQI